MIQNLNEQKDSIQKNNGNFGICNDEGHEIQRK